MSRRLTLYRAHILAISTTIGLLMMTSSCGGESSQNSNAIVLPVSSPAPTPTPSPTPPPTGSITLNKFGFAAVVCDHDDPFDSSAKTDYSDEVLAFTNANQVCVTGDEATDANRLADAATKFEVIFYIEPVFFDFSGGSGTANADRVQLWEGVRRSITNSGVDPKTISFYLADEPSLRGLKIDDVNVAARFIKADYPDSPIIVIEAFSATDDPVVPEEIDIWGFNAYTVPDPGADVRYTGYLDKASAQLRAGQSLVVVGDGIYTPFHSAAGLTENDMADVADNYLKLARSRKDVSMLLVYTWAGGIDNLDEKGVRDLPLVVQDRWRTIGRDITGK